jgi:hypothetical protein
VIVAVAAFVVALAIGFAAGRGVQVRRRHRTVQPPWWSGFERDFWRYVETGHAPPPAADAPPRPRRFRLRPARRARAAR